MLKDHMFPSSNAKYVFMGCGRRGGSHIKMGVIGTREELFRQTGYAQNTYLTPRKVRQFYPYYSTTRYAPIGFSGHKTIQLNYYDVYASTDETKLSVYTSRNDGYTLLRCGSDKNKPADFQRTYEIVFYSV